MSELFETICYLFESHKHAKQCFLIELSVIIEMSYICTGRGHIWLLSCWNMASVTEFILFYFN